jgi:hypothetical protein
MLGAVAAGGAAAISVFAPPQAVSKAKSIKPSARLCL